MAVPQTWQWSEHILSKGKNKLICSECNQEAKLPTEPGEDIEDKDKRIIAWIKRIRAIGEFVTKHKSCYY